MAVSVTARVNQEIATLAFGALDSRAPLPRLTTEGWDGKDWLRWATIAVLFLSLGCAAHVRAIPTSDPPSTASACVYQGQLPDPVCTPGAIDPSVTQDNIDQTICRSGYTALVRPPVAYTDGLKIMQMERYGVGGQSTKDFEEDHLIALELGGAPSDPLNLWPEPGASPNAKDSVEDKLRRLVCNRQMPLSDAQQRIATNWTTALP